MGKILGQPIKEAGIELLYEAANILYSSRSDDVARRNDYGQLLAKHGIKDRRVLLAKGSKWLRRQEFPPYGKGRGFAGAILGRPVEIINHKVLHEIANELGFPKLNEEGEGDKMDGHRRALAEHGMTDRASLLAKGTNWFNGREANFPPYGKGKAFAYKVLDRPVKRITRGILDEMAEKLQLPDRKTTLHLKHNLEKKKLYVQALKLHKITNRDSLLKKGPRWFRSPEAKFPPYGKGLAFVRAILGRSVKRITKDVLSEIADILFPEKVQ